MGINLPAVGLHEWFALAKESGYGTQNIGGGASTTQFFRTLSFRGGRKQPAMESAGPSGTPTDLVAGRSFKGTQRIGIQCSTLLNYEDWVRILPNLFGTAGYTFSAGPPRLHNGTLPIAIPTAMPYSLTVIRNSNLQQVAFAGCVIRSATFSGAADRIATLELDLVCQTGGYTDITPPSATFSTAPWVEHPHLTPRWHGTPATAKGAGTAQNAGAGMGEWSVKITNPLREEPIAGADTIREPIWNGFRTVEITLAREYFDTNFLASFNAASTTAARLEWFDTLELDFDSGISAGTGNYRLKFYAPYATIKENTQDMADVGQVPESITFKAGTDGAAAPFEIDVYNNQNQTMA